MKKLMSLMLVIIPILVVFTGYGHSVEGTDVTPSAVFASAGSEHFVLSIEHNNQDKEFKEAMEAARKLLKEPIGKPPVPPDINLKCSEGVALERLGGVYYKSLVQPEEALCQKLLSAAKQLRLASSDAEEKANDAMITAGLLFKRNFRKVDAVIRAYRPSPEKFGAVGYASLRVYKEAALLGEKEPPPYGVFSEWAAKAADKYLEELRKNHDYKAISAVVQLTKEAQMLGMPEADLNFFDKMARAMNFKVDFDVSCWVSAGPQTVTLKGSVTLRPDGTLMLLMGEGKGEYVSYNSPVKSRSWIEVPNSYSITMKLLEFKPCEGTVKLSVDKIGADKETWVCPELKELGGRFTAPGEHAELFVKSVADECLQGYRAEGGGFEFPMPISNLQAQMCTGNFTQTGTIRTSGESTSASITYNVTITHILQSDLSPSLSSPISEEVQHEKTSCCALAHWSSFVSLGAEDRRYRV